MQIQVNGEPRELADKATISVLVTQMALEGQRYAIEVNEENEISSITVNNKK